MKDYPYTRKVGRYAFYAACAFSLGIVASFFLMEAGLARDFAKQAVFPVFVVAFLALRDSEKNAVLTAFRAQIGEDALTSPEIAKGLRP